MSQVATTEPAVNKYNDPQANPAINVKVRVSLDRRGDGDVALSVSATL